MKIKSITYSGKADVYNMEVSDTHNFAVENGIIIHNCYDMNKYMLMTNPIAQKKAVKKPSRYPNPLEVENTVADYTKFVEFI